MNTAQTRREFFADVGRGMIVATVGSSIATELGLARAMAEGSDALTFGNLEPLVSLMQETPVTNLLPALGRQLMSRELPAEQQALPVIKVLYRNTNRIQEKGGRKEEVLHVVSPGAAAQEWAG